MEPKNIFIALIIFVIIIIGYLVISDSETNDDQAILNDPSLILNEDEMTNDMKEVDSSSLGKVEEGETAEEMNKAEIISEIADATMDEDPKSDMVDEQVTTAGKYIDYDASMLASSGADHQVLNFSASWCPSCRTLDKNINTSAGDIPVGTIIYKVDYDSNTDLRKKYGVTSQHTLVEVDANGNLIQKWTGGSTLDSVLAKL